MIHNIAVFVIKYVKFPFLAALSCVDLYTVNNLCNTIQFNHIITDTIIEVSNKYEHVNMMNLPWKSVINTSRDTMKCAPMKITQHPKNICLVFVDIANGVSLNITVNLMNNIARIKKYWAPYEKYMILVRILIPFLDE